MVLIAAAFVFASDDALTAVSDITPTARPVYVGKLGVGYNGGLNVRFWPSEALGLEIPLSGSFSDPYQKYDSPIITYNWSVSSGINFLIPIKNNFGISMNFVPGIILGAGETFSESTYTSGTYYEVDSFVYSFSTGVTVGLEAEVFLNRLYDKLPSNISIGSKIALNGTVALNENWDKYFYFTGKTGDLNFKRQVNYNLAMANSGSTLTAFTIRYYF